jgi:hypothetical protein
MQFYNDNLEAHEDWFWDFVEYNQTHEGELEHWFRECTPRQMIDFYRAYLWIQDSLVAPYEGIFLISIEDHLSEDSQGDFNDWIIVQGKALCEKAMDEAMKRLDADHIGEPYDDSVWEALFEIYHQCRMSPSEKFGVCRWLGVEWIPRNGHFPGMMADYIYEERFRGFIGDKLD